MYGRPPRQPGQPVTSGPLRHATCPANGARFTFRNLPCVKVRATGQTAPMALFGRRAGNRTVRLPDAAPPAPAPRRLLVADDNRTVTQLLEMLFGREGWHVTVVDSGEACLAELPDADPDVVVLDQQMDGITGLETAQQLRDAGFDRPILLFSAHLDDAARECSLRLSVDPVSKVDFPAVVRHVESAYRRAHPVTGSSGSLLP